MKKLAWVAALAMLASGPTGAVGMFGQGQVQFQAEIGNGYAFKNSYLILGAGVRYYVIDGLGLGLAYEHWSGNGPGISKITPSLQYVFDHASSVKPYVGVFYRHATVTGLPAINSVGGRAGVYLAAGSRAALGLGYVHESYLNCQTAVYLACSESYPEVSLVFGF